jgi:tetratricopeptide (TPR) repeat protein
VPSESLTTSLYMTTGGNPLFVEQLVLALAEGGELRLRGGVWDGSVDIRGAPPIVREVIAQRLARLSESCRRTLAMIAVLGQSTEHSVLLATLEPIDEAVVLNDLEESIAASVLQETPGGYGFCHVLLRDAVYWNLSQPQRIRLHSRAADAIEQMAGPRAMDRAAELAHHYVLAGQSPSYRASALRYSLEAGRRARTISANREALTHFTQAVGLFERRGAPAETGQRAEAYEGQGQAQRGLGLWSDAVASFRQVLAVAADPIQRGRAHAEIASALNHMGQTSQALAESDAGMAEISVAGGPAPTGVRSHLLALKAYVWFFEGRFEQLLHLGEEMIAAAREIGQPRLLSAAHSVRGWAYMGRGSVREALAEYQLALAAAVASEDKMDIAMGHVNLGVQSYLGARLSEARVHLETGIQMFREAAGELRIINALQHLGRVSLAEGDLELARTHADLALELATEQHDRWAADCRDLLANIHVLRTEWEAAQPYYEQALEVRREVGFKAGIVDALLGLGAVHHRRGDFATAMPRFLEAEQVVGTMDVCPQSLAVRRHLGRLHIAANDLNAARAQLDPALELLRHVSDTYEVAPTFLACAELEATCGNLELAVQHAEHAYQASRSAEHIAESSAMIGALYATTDNLTVGQSAVTAGLKMAMRLDAPRLIALNHLAAARLAVAAGDDHLAQHSFDESRRAFERARIPIELAAVERESRSRSLVLGDATQRQR